MRTKKESPWVTVGIVAIVLAPLAILVGYAVVLIHFLIKFW